MEKRMNKEKAESYVYYFAEKYLSYSQLRQSIGIFVIITYFALYFGLEKSAVPFCLTLLVMTVIYTFCIILFQRKISEINSFRLRFLVSGSVGMFITLYFLIFAVMSYSLAKKNTLLGGLVMAACLCLFIAISTCITVISVRNGRYLREIRHDPKREILIILLGGILFFVAIGGIPSRSNQLGAVRALCISCLVISALSSLAGGNLLKYYWCKKYGISCDPSGKDASNMLLKPDLPKKSRPKRVLKGLLLGALAVFLAATLFGAYHVS